MGTGVNLVSMMIVKGRTDQIDNRLSLSVTVYVHKVRTAIDGEDG
jgi:hypothetical protein